jgi:hypothetical protein
MTLYTTIGNASVNADGYVRQNGSVVTNEFIWVESAPSNTDENARGILGFNISSLVGKTIVSAKLRVYLYSYDDVSNSVIVDHIDFGSSIDAGDYNSVALAGNIGTISNNTVSEWKELNVKDYVQNDLNNGRTSSQYRFKFSSAYVSTARFIDAENTGCQCLRYLPELVVTYQ